jgi:hypothetical protein
MQPVPVDYHIQPSDIILKGVDPFGRWRDIWGEGTGGTTMYVSMMIVEFFVRWGRGWSAFTHADLTQAMEMTWYVVGERRDERYEKAKASPYLRTPYVIEHMFPREDGSLLFVHYASGQITHRVVHQNQMCVEGADLFLKILTDRGYLIPDGKGNYSATTKFVDDCYQASRGPATHVA